MELNKEFVSYEQALALKELGFDEECFGWYDKNANLYLNIQSKQNLLLHSISNRFNGSILSPLKQQVFRWFRKKYGYDSLVTYTQNKYLGFVTDHKTGYYLTATNDFSIYEEAEDALIDKLIELIKQQADGRENKSN